MTCPGPDVELCCDQTPCIPCPVVIADVEWTYMRRLGWHEPDRADACPAVQASSDDGVVRGLTNDRSRDTREPQALATPRAPRDDTGASEASP